jgi:hypothetical protein
MKTVMSSKRHHYLAAASIFLIVAALVTGTIGCGRGGATTRHYLLIVSTEGGQVVLPGEDAFIYDEGTVVNLIAEADQGCHFVEWSGNTSTIANVESATTTITMNDSYFIYAVFGLEIRDWRDLDAIRDNLVGSHTLMNDLDSTSPGYEQLAGPTANEGQGWQPIGPSSLSAFTGTFDGQGFEIRDLFINRPDESPVGLFGPVEEEGVIKDVGLVNAMVTGYFYVGALAGYSNGIVTNSYSTGNVSSTIGMVGGLVGKNTDTISSSYSTASVTGVVNVGGLVGDNWGGTVSNSYSTGNTIGSTCVGGLVAYNNRGIVNHSYSTGSVTGDEEVGGLVGRNYEGTTSDSFWDTETSGQGISDGGTGKSTLEMKDTGTFSDAGWDIVAVTPGSTNSTYIWNIVDDITYPFPSWQPVT